MAGAKTRAILSGSGDLPRLLAEKTKEDQINLLVVYFGEMPSWVKNYPSYQATFEKLGRLFAELKRQRVTEVCMAGAMKRPRLKPTKFDIPMWSMALKLLPALKRGDDATLREVLKLFEDRGFRVISAQEIAPELQATTKMKINAKLTAQDHRDIDRGLDILKGLSAADIGQGCVVANGLCLGVETIQGTEAMLGFAGKGKSKKGGVFIKAPKHGQDRRVDMPTIGVDTVRQVAKAGLNGIALIEDGALVLDRAKVAKAANEAGIFITVLHKGLL